MKRLSGSNAFTLAMETPHAYMHTLKIAIIDPPNIRSCASSFHRSMPNPLEATCVA